MNETKQKIITVHELLYTAIVAIILASVRFFENIVLRKKKRESFIMYCLNIVDISSSEPSKNSFVTSRMMLRKA